MIRALLSTATAAALLCIGLTFSAQAQDYSGAYSGFFTASKGPSPRPIQLGITQSGTQMTATFATSGGGGGCFGYYVFSTAILNCSSFSFTCPGRYTGVYTFTAGEVDWRYEGQDCNGAQQGRGTATKAGVRARHAH